MYFDAIVPKVLDDLSGERPPPGIVDFWVLKNKDKCHGQHQPASQLGEKYPELSTGMGLRAGIGIRESKSLHCRCTICNYCSVDCVSTTNLGQNLKVLYRISAPRISRRPPFFFRSIPSLSTKEESDASLPASLIA